MRKILLTAVGLALFAGLLYVSGIDDLSTVLHPDPGLTLIAGVLIAAQLFVFAMRWRVVTGNLADVEHVTAFDFYFYAVSSLAMGQFLPQTASVVVIRSAMLNRLQGVSLQRSLLSVILDKFFDLLMIVLLAVPALQLVLGLVSVNASFGLAVGILGGAGLVVTLQGDFTHSLIMGLIRVGGSLLQRLPLPESFKTKLSHLDQWDILQGSVMQRMFWLTILGQGVMALRTWAIAQAVGTEISLPAAFVAVAFAQASILFAFTPGSLGILEIGWYAAFAAIGVPSEEIAVFMVAHRVFTAMTTAILWLGLYGLNLLIPHQTLSEDMPGQDIQR